MQQSVHQQQRAAVDSTHRIRVNSTSNNQQAAETGQTTSQQQQRHDNQQSTRHNNQQDNETQQPTRDTTTNKTGAALTRQPTSLVNWYKGWLCSVGSLFPSDFVSFGGLVLFFRISHCADEKGRTVLATINQARLHCELNNSHGLSNQVNYCGP